MYLKILAHPRPDSVTPHVSHIDFGPDQSEYLFSDDGKKLTIKLGNIHGVADGKQLLTFLLSTKTNSVLKAKLQGIETLNIEVGNGNPQFVYFYTLFPPGLFPSPFQKADGSFPKINVYYPDKTAFALFHTLCTAMDDTVGFFSQLMGKESAALIPEKEKINLLQHLEICEFIFKENPNFVALKPYVTSTISGLKSVILNEVREDREISRTPSVIDRNEVTTLHVIDTLSLNSRLSTASVHVQTDQVSHIFSSENARFIVDDGHPHTYDYLTGHDKKTNVFMITHFHDDHVIYLAQDLQLSCDDGKETHLIIQEGCEQQFIGYLLSHPELIERIQAGKITFEIISKKSKALVIDTQEILPYLASEELKHFIHSAGFIVFDKTKNKIRLYTGDINPQLTDKTQAFKEAFIRDCEKVLKIANNNGVTEVDIYYDQGHFPEGTMEADDIQTLLKSTCVELNIGVLNLYPEHRKCSEGVGEFVDHL